MTDFHPSRNIFGVPQNVVDSFLSKIEFPENPEGCWRWKGKLNEKGYGHFGFDYRPYPAHRFSYMLSVGDTPRGKHVHHKCDNPSCVNPNHLEILTPAQHVDVTTGHPKNKTHCKRGHEFTKENTHIYRGNRVCKVCIREKRRKKDADGNPKPRFSSLYCKHGHPLFGDNMRMAKHKLGYVVRQCKACSLAAVNRNQAKHRDRVLASKKSWHAGLREKREAKRVAAIRGLLDRASEMDDKTLLESFVKAVSIDPAP